jgi:hypothetical protein
MSLHLLDLDRLGPECEFERDLVWNPKRRPVRKYREDVVARAFRKLRWRFFYEPVIYDDPGRVMSRHGNRVMFDYLVFLPGDFPVQVEVTTSRRHRYEHKLRQAARVSKQWGIPVIVLGPDYLDQIEANVHVLEWIVESALAQPLVA